MPSVSLLFRVAKNYEIGGRKKDFFFPLPSSLRAQGTVSAVFRLHTLSVVYWGLNKAFFPGFIASRKKILFGKRAGIAWEKCGRRKSRRKTKASRPKVKRQLPCFCLAFVNTLKSEALKCFDSPEEEEGKSVFAFPPRNAGLFVLPALTWTSLETIFPMAFSATHL